MDFALPLPLPLPPRVKRLGADKGDLERGEPLFVPGTKRAREFPWVAIVEGLVTKRERRNLVIFSRFVGYSQMPKRGHKLSSRSIRAFTEARIVYIEL